MTSPKIWGFLAIAGCLMSASFESANAQINIGSTSSQTAISPSHQMLLDMQTNAPAVGGGSMQLLRFTDKNVSFVPLEGLNNFFNWQLPQGEKAEEEATTGDRTIGDRIENFKQAQRRQIISDSQMFEAMNRIAEKENSNLK